MCMGSSFSNSVSRTKAVSPGLKNVKAMVSLKAIQAYAREWTVYRNKQVLGSGNYADAHKQVRRAEKRITKILKGDN